MTRQQNQGLVCLLSGDKGCWGLTDVAGPPEEGRRALAGVVAIQVQAGASVFAGLGGALVLV